MLRTEALQDLSETHSHRMVVTLVIVVLVLINTLYVAGLTGIEPSRSITAKGRQVCSFGSAYVSEVHQTSGCVVKKP